MANLIELDEIPGFRLVDAYDLTELKNAINQLYQGAISVRVSQALTIEMSSTDYGVVVAPLVPSAVSVFLRPDPVAGDSCFVKDGNGMAASHQITVYPDVGTIDGAATYVLSHTYQSNTFVYNGAQWNVI